MQKPPPGGGTSDRRMQFGPSQEGMGIWSPQPQLSTRGQPTGLADDAKRISRVLLAAQSPMTKAQIVEHVGARYWGPQAFNRALRYALDQQMIRQISPGMFAPPEKAPGEKKEESRPAEA